MAASSHVWGCHCHGRPRRFVRDPENLGSLSVREDDFLQGRCGRSNMPIHGAGRPIRVGLDQGTDDRQMLRDVIGSRIVGPCVSKMAHIAQCPEQDEISTDLGRQPHTAGRFGDQTVQASVRRARVAIPGLIPGQGLKSSQLPVQCRQLGRRNSTAGAASRLGLQQPGGLD